MNLDLTQHPAAPKQMTAEEHAASIEAKFEQAQRVVRAGLSGIQHGGLIIEHEGIKYWRWVTDQTGKPDIPFRTAEELRSQLP